MSRIGKQPIIIPANTTVRVEGGLVTVKGPKGELARSFLPDVSVVVEDNTVLVRPQKETIFTHAMWGTTAAHIKNMIHGVNALYEKKLVIEGIGYKAEISGENLILNIGFSHPVSLPVPKDIKVVVGKNIITVTGIGKESVGQFAAVIRAQKPPEPYKGKGIRYENEVIRRKQGKRAA